MSTISAKLLEDKFDFITDSDKSFIIAFDDEMTMLGYGCGGKIGDGYCWGRYMLIYYKLGVKSKQVFARIYIREECLVLRLFLNEIDRHQSYFDHSPRYITEVFTGAYGDCTHCHNEKAGKCQFRKSYTLENRLMEKCNSYTFEFHETTLAKLPDYIGLFTEFYPVAANNIKISQTTTLI